MNNRNLNFQNKFTKTNVPKSTSGLDELYKIVKINQNKFQETELKEKENPVLFESKILYKEKVSLVPIDSIYRNQDIYPEPNHFVISLRKKFQNIKSLELVASIFPNTDNAIINSGPRQNNKLYWQNQEDLYSFFLTGISVVFISSGIFKIAIPNYTVVSKKIKVFMWSSLNPNVNGSRILFNNFDGTFTFYSFEYSSTFICDLNVPTPVYSSSITEGNYNINTICTEIGVQMKKVLRGDNITFHYFYITPNLDTDLITFESLITKELSNNPISTVISTYIISVNSPTSNVVSGDVRRILGSNSVGGINSTILNDEFKIVPVIGGFNYTVTTKSSTTSTGGGNSVVIGKPDKFKFLFSELDRFNEPTFLGSIQKPLGFFGEESNEYINQINPLSTVSFPITSISVGTTTTVFITGTISNVIKTVTNLTVTNITNNIITTSTVHKIEDESQIQLYCLNCILSSGKKTNLVNLVQVLAVSKFKLKIVSSSTNISVISLGTTSLIKYGDRIRLQGIKLNSTKQNFLGNNQFFVESISGNSFIINYATTGFTFVIENSITNTAGISLNKPNPYVTTSLLKVNHPKHGFNEIVEITKGLSYVNSFAVICKLNHSINNIQRPFISLVPYSNPDYILISTTLIGNIDENLNINVGDFINIFIVGAVNSDRLEGKFTAKVTVFNFIVPGFASISFIVYLPGYNYPTGSDGSEYIYSFYKPLIISGTNSLSNSLDGVYNIYDSYIADNTIENISYFGTKIETVTNGKGTINTKNNDIRLFRATSNIGASIVADVPLNVINNYNRATRLIDLDHYYINIENFFFFGSSIQFGGNVTVASDLHGFNSNRSNTKDWTVNTPISRKVSLEGDNYVFLSIPQPKMDSVVVNPTSDVSDVFAQILLSESPGNIIFNSFVSVPYIFDPYLPTIDSFELKVLYTDSNLYDFKDTDFSITLKVTEVIIKLESEEEKEQQNTKRISDRNI